MAGSSYIKNYIVRRKACLIFKISVLKNVLKCFGKGITFPAKVRNIQKIERKKQPALVFLVIRIRKNTQSMRQKTLSTKTCLFVTDIKNSKKAQCSYQRF